MGALIVVAVVLLGLAGQRWLRPASSGGDPPDTVVPDEPGTTTTTTLDQIEIPDVLDQPRDEAEQAFDNLVGEAGTEIDVEFEYEADTVPTDDPGLDEHIAAQDPEAGETVSPEGDILVTLTLYGFEEPTTTLPPTTTGNPQGNGNEHHNTTTTHPVTTTTAPHTTPVPHVVGQHVDTARVNVEEAGFVPHISSSCVGDNCVVTAQNPAGGASAPAGSTVTLTAEDEIPDLEAP